MDRADNVIEGLLTLQDYASRQGTPEQLEFVREFIPTDSQNSRLESLLRQFWLETQAEIIQDIDANLIVKAMMRVPTIPLDNELTTPNSNNESVCEEEDPLPADLFDLDEAMRKEVLKEIDVVLLKPFVPPTKKAEPISPLKVQSLKRVASSYLRSDLMNYDDVERMPCQYGTDKLKCSRMAKKTFIHCRHHLQVASRKYQAAKNKKRLRESMSSAADLLAEEDVQYDGIL